MIGGVKSIHSGDPDVIRNTRTYKASPRHQAICLASAIRPTFYCNSCVFMYGHVGHALGGAMSRADMLMFRIAINKLFSRVLGSHSGDTGLIPGRDMSVLGWR